MSYVIVRQYLNWNLVGPVPRKKTSCSLRNKTPNLASTFGVDYGVFGDVEVFRLGLVSPRAMKVA